MDFSTSVHLIQLQPIAAKSKQRADGKNRLAASRASACFRASVTEFQSFA
jgi:hypothetical protein